MLTHLVEAEEAQVSHNTQGTDPGARGDLSSHLQSDLNDFQRIGENHLGCSSLQDSLNKKKKKRRKKREKGKKTKPMSSLHADTEVSV